MKKILATLALTLVCMTSTFVFAGPVGGPTYNAVKVEARSKYTLYGTFRGNEMAEVQIQGDGDTDVDVYVYDDNGNLITQGIGLTDRENVRFFVNRTSSFRIELRNLGNVWNRVEVWTR